MSRWVSLVVLAACGGSTARPVPPPATAAVAIDPDGPHKAAVAAQLQPLVDAELANGVVIGLYDAGKREIYGFGKGPGGKPPTGDTLFELGSLTHIYTGLLYADAVQRKEVEMETPVAELLPPGVTVPTADKTAITLKHLALHSSGLPAVPMTVARRLGSPDPFAGYGEDQLYRDLVSTTLAAAPGTRVARSDYGVGLLAFALGKKLNTGGFAGALEKRVFAPLGLESTFFAVPDSAASRRATGTDDDLAPVAPWTYGALAGAGGLVSSARDQLALIDAELDAAAGSTRSIRAPMRLTQEAQLDSSGANEGLGWNIDSGGRYWQIGTTGGFRSFIGFDPKTRRGVVILASSSISLIDTIAKRMYGLLDDETLKAPVFPSAAKLERFAGTYQFDKFKLVMKASGKRMYVEGPGEPPMRMLPVSDHEFWIEQLQTVAVFDPFADKSPNVIFIIGEHQVTAPRVPD